MSTQPYLLGDGDSDYRLHENAKERRPNCHIPKDAAAGALAVSVNTGSLGGTDTLSVAPGPVVVAGQRFDIAQQSVGVDRGNSRPRRDVVFVTDAGTIDVLRGDPADRAWGPGVSDSQRTLGNSFLPAPRSMASTVGVPIAVVSVPGNNATSLADDPATVDIGVRPFERETFDLSESFADGEFGYRRLSEFTSLQAAIDHSGQTATAIYVDGQFTFDEANIDLPPYFTLVGDFNGSRIDIDNATSDPLFRYSGSGASNFQMAGIHLFNRGSAKPFMAPDSASAPGILTRTTIEDILLQNFGGDPYTVHLDDAFGVQFNNILINNKNAPSSHGGIKLTNCNACEFAGLKVIGNTPPNGETPAVYASACAGTTFDSLHCEYNETDAVVQLDGGAVTIDGLHVEPHADPGSYCGVQLGDGGIAKHGTNGAVGRGWFELTNPVIHGMNAPNGNDDQIRVLNAHQTVLSGGGQGPSDTINYGGAQNPNVTLGEARPGPVHITGRESVNIIDNWSDGPAAVTIQNGKVFSSLTEAQNGDQWLPQLQPYEVGWVADANGWAMVRADAAGDIHTWRADGRETTVGPVTNAYTASSGETVFVDTSTASVTVTLPAATEGAHIRVQNTTSNTGNSTNVETADSATIDGSAPPVSVSGAGAARDLVCDGTDWWAIR